jgi:hypothetical protein
MGGEAVDELPEGYSRRSEDSRAVGIVEQSLELNHASY